MAFKTFAPGVLTSSDVNTFLMRQAVITCTSSTRPSSPSEGMTIYETDTDSVLTYSGSTWEHGYDIGAWTAFTPTLGNWTLGDAAHDCAYIQIGRLVAARYEIEWGSSSAFSSGLQIALPVTGLAPSVFRRIIGVAYTRDTSLNVPYAHSALQYSANYWEPASIGVGGSYATYDAINPTTPATWASGDTFSATITYEAAA